MSRTRILVTLGLFLWTIFFAALLGSIGGNTAAQAAATVTFTAPPFVGTYFAPTAIPTACRVPQTFKPGDIVVLIPGIALRVAPNPDSALLQQFSDRREFAVVEGPVCQSGFNWWRLSGHGYNGWAAEGRENLV